MSKSKSESVLSPNEVEEWLNFFREAGEIKCDILIFF